jgi:hypothetical protein
MTETPERAIELLKTFVDDDPCRLDHHGNCQTHSLGNPCNVAEAREFLASLGEPVSQEAPNAQQMREALSGIECSLAEFCDESAPNRETMVADAARDAVAAIADLRRNRCRSGEMCSVDGCSSTAVAWRDERGVSYCDQCKQGVSRMRSRSRKTFNPIVLDRLSASAPSPEDKGSDNG